MSACRDCGVSIEWAVTDRARTMPVEEPSEDGNLYAWRTPTGQLRVTANRPRGRDFVMVKSHFASCPAANERRAKR